MYVYIYIIHTTSTNVNTKYNIMSGDLYMIIIIILVYK